jgi:hypothetical protein
MRPEGMQRSQVIELALVDDDPHDREMFARTVQDHPDMALVHVADRGPFVPVGIKCFFFS